MSQPRPLSCLQMQLFNQARSRTWGPLAAVSQSDLKLERKDQMSVLMGQSKMKPKASAMFRQRRRRCSWPSMQRSPKAPLRVVAAARRRDVRRASAGRRRCGKPTPGSPRIQGDVGDRRALACRAPRRSTADGHRLLSVVLRTTAERRALTVTDRKRTATHVPVRGPFEVSQPEVLSCLMDVVDPSDEGVSDESVCGRCDWSDR